MLAIRIPADLEARLDKLAKSTGRSKSFYAREAIEQHIEDLEDAYLAVKRLEKPGKHWTLSDLEQGLDLGD